jgi:glycosyltransferase involved in cell wall biosynthesis
MSKVAFFIGAHISPNVVLDVTNMGWMLREEFELDLVATRCDETQSHFEEFDKYLFNGTSKLAEFKGLRDYLDEQQPDAVVQVTEPTQHGWITSLLKRKGSCKLVYRYDSDSFYSYKVRSGAEKAKYFALHNVLGQVPPRVADRCIVLGPNGSNRLESRGVNQDRIDVLPPTVNANRLRNDRKWNLEIEQENVVLFVGRLNEQKGFDLLMDSIDPVVNKRSDIHFVVVGDGDRSVSIPGRLENHVTLAGYVPMDEIGAYYHNSDLLVLPSMREGLPRVILEAMTCGLTVIATDVGEISSVTENVVNDQQEFIEHIINFEELPVANEDRFTRETQREDHVRFFRTIVNDR